MATTRDRKMNGRLSLLFALFLSFVGLVGDKRIGMTNAKVSVESLRRHVENMLFDRSPNGGYPGLERAAHYIREEFLKAGLDVREDAFSWEGKFYKNVIAEKKGGTS